MMFVAWPVVEALEIIFTGGQRVPGVELGDRDEQERHGETDQRAAVELAEAEGVVVEGERDGDETGRREHRRRQHRSIEGVDDRAAAPDPGEERPDDRRDDRDTADRERVRDDLERGEVDRAEEHDRHRGHGVRLEQVGGHAGAVADVVADVVRDHGWVARVVLRDAGLDLADEVGADVGGLREDAAAEPREHGDQRAAEREPDEIPGRVLGALVEPGGENAVVGGDAEQAEPDHEQARDRACVERDLEGRPDAVLRRLGGADVGADGDVHADEAGRGGEHGTDQEPERDAPPEIVPEADTEEEDDRDDRDGQVLATKVGGGSLLDGARDLLHPLRARGLAQEPDGQPKAPGDPEPRAEQSEQHGVVLEEAGHDPPAVALTNSAPSAPPGGREARLRSQDARRAVLSQAGAEGQRAKGAQRAR